jgi:DNA repair protein RadD
MRLGPINDVSIHVAKKGIGHRRPPLKVCPSCKALQPPAVRVCDVCGFKFEFKTKLSTTAGTVPVVRTKVEVPKPKWHFIEDVKYTLHHKTGRPTSLKVTYRVGLQTFSEWICYDHDGYAKRKADNWVRFRAPKGMPMPKSVFELHEWAPWLKRPVQALLNFSEKFPQIKDVKFTNVWGANAESSNSEKCT